MAASNSDTVRYERYQRVIAAVAARGEFSLVDIKDACPDELPSFVTRIVRYLEADGYLTCEEAKGDYLFCWAGERDEFSPARWIDSKIYNDRITRAPLDDRPRERLLAEGAASLRTAELLAILVRSGLPGESALQAGEKIAARYSDKLERLTDAGRGELKTLSRAVGKMAYCQIMAGIELGRRVVDAGNRRQQKKICSSAEALKYCKSKFGRLAENRAQEEFHIVTLDTKNQVIDTHAVSVGALDQTLVHPREVFRPAIKDAAKSIILVHNHPSGDPTPSDQDRVLTERLEQAGRIVGMQVLDHVIVARNGAVSLREHESKC